MNVFKISSIVWKVILNPITKIMRKRMDNTTEWDLSTWWKLLDQKFAPHKRMCEGLAARNLFLNFQQGELSFLEWETKLKHLILECKYPKETTSVLFRDLLAAGCKSSKARFKIYKNWINAKERQSPLST